MTVLAAVPQPGDHHARLAVTRSLRHRLARRRLSPYVGGCVPVLSPHLDRLRAAAFEPCWRTSPEGREYVAALEHVLDGRGATSNEVAQGTRE